MSTWIMRAAGAVVVLAAGLFVSDARAQIFYLGGEAGWSVLQDQTDKAPKLAPAKVRYSDGFAAGVRAGYEWGPWRFEEEYVYRNHDLSSLSVGATKVAGVTGSRESHALMTNLLYEFNIPAIGWPLRPHIGAGVGAVNLIDHGRAPGIGKLFNDDDWVFGYQAIGGVRYDVTPNVALDVDYRYLATSDATFRLPAAPAIRYKTGYETHTLMASLVYRFGPPPAIAPPVPPAPPVAARKVFLVFFDWDKATITAEGMTIVQQAADAYRAGGRVQLQVTGYADRSGSPGYNQRLSERRATAVADALSRLGVPKSDMMISGRGENDNRVPTADGVREPQNRRVEIVFP
jgi:OOP family OmpA-OmpF porin